MNSLQELNGYGNGTVSYTDNRPAGITFDRVNTTNQLVTINQHDTHQVYTGIEIVEVIRAADCTPTYTVNVSSITGATVSWATVPSGCTVTNPSTGVYRISGVNSKSIWNIVKRPTVSIPANFVGVGSYSATITYNTTQTKTWNVSLTVIDITNMDTADDFYFLGGVNGLIVGNPQVIDNYPTTWNVTVTPSTASLITSLTTAGSGGTVSFNGTTKVLSISGTKTQVNSHLNSISYVIPSTTKQDFTLQYVADNVALSEGDSKVQQMYTTEYLSATRASESYTINTLANISNGPLVTDANYTGTGLYTMTITPSDTAAVSSMGSSVAVQYYPRNAVGTTNITLRQALDNQTYTTISGSNAFVMYESDYSSAGITSGKEIRGLGLPDETIISSIGSTFYIGPIQYRTLYASNNFTQTTTGAQTLAMVKLTVSNISNTRALVVSPGLNYFAYSKQEVNQVYVYEVSGSEVFLRDTLQPSGHPSQGVYPLYFGSVVKANTSFDVMAIVAGGDNLPAQGAQVEKGAVYIFRRSGTTWTQELRAINSNTDSNYDYKYVELSPQGNTFVTSPVTSSVVANNRMDFWNYRAELPGEYFWYKDSTITFSEQREIIGFSNDETYFFLASPYTPASGINGAGSVYVYKRTGNTWAQDTIIYPANPVLNGNFGGYGTRKMPDGTFALGQTNDVTEIYSLVSGTWTRTSTLNYGVPSNSYSMTSDANYYAGEDTVYKLTATGYTKLVYIGDNSLVETANSSNYYSYISSDGTKVLQFLVGADSQPKFYYYTDGDPNRISFNATTKVLTMTDTKAFLNERLDTITLTPATDYESNFVLTYSVTTPNSVTYGGRQQNVNRTT
jgi:hypothetical protein